ncbi:MAG: SGNH/GDSL hydrolase family protein [Clostridia bacterium]|nr:SGNH/GDSL hydrolase family protein [Clostridia bacterium]
MINCLSFSLFCKRLISLAVCLALAAGAAAPAPSATQLPEADDGTYRYLAIGNSIVRHPECEYWWNDAGMAASDAEHDYFHIVTEYLKEQHPSVEAAAVGFVEWEIASAGDRSVYSLIDQYLTKDLNLITVQLSENVSQTRGLGKRLAELVRYIQKRCPKAELILVDDFWDDAKSEIKKKAARTLGIPFANLSAIRGREEYMRYVGDWVTGSDGQPHFIEREDVARHPNDKGMQAIAQAIISQMRKGPRLPD